MTIDNRALIEEIRKSFLEEACFLLEECEESYLDLAKPEKREAELAKIFRLAHTIKAASASVGFSDLSKFAHVVEDCLTILRVKIELVSPEVISLLLRAGDALKQRVEMLKSKSEEHWEVSSLQKEIQAMVAALGGEKISSCAAADIFKIASQSTKKTGKGRNIEPSTVKIDTRRIDAMLDVVGELVVLKGQLVSETQEYKSNLKLHSLVAMIGKTVRELQDHAVGMKMTSLKTLFLKTQRTVRDLSLDLGKLTEFKMSGEHIEINRTTVEMLSDALVHIARNAIDHGVEKPQKRREQGKAEYGAIYLEAKQVDGRVIVTVSDDGAGLSRDKILTKAIETGLIPNSRKAESLTDQEVFQLIFVPGFSTSETITDVSGRGVGMDIVKSSIDSLNGSIEIRSLVGQGTTFVISIPLTPN